MELLQNEHNKIDFMIFGASSKMFKMISSRFTCWMYWDAAGIAWLLAELAAGSLAVGWLYWVEPDDWAGGQMVS